MGLLISESAQLPTAVEWGGGIGITWGIIELKTKVKSAAADQNQCLLLGEACLAAPGGAALWKDIAAECFLCSCQIQRLSLIHI